MSNGVTRCEGWVRPAVIKDLSDMLPMREADAIEIEVTGRDPIRALYESFEVSKPHVFTIIVDGKPCGIFGAAQGHAACCGIPWMLGNDQLRRIPRDLIVQGRMWIEYLNRIFPHLENAVHSDNRVSIRWLTAMGFEVHPQPIILPNGHSFRRFTRDV